MLIRFAAEPFNGSEMCFSVRVAWGISKKTFFVIEVSSYQLEYSKIFSAKYAVILNISVDHIERHKTINKYVKAKFKLIKHQSKGHLAFV